MQKIRYNFLFVIGLMLILGAGASVFSQSKTNKNSGILTVKTSPQSYPVKVDGQVIGMSGVANEAVFYLTPGDHTVEVEVPGGQKFTKTINFKKGEKHCVCLKVDTITSKRPCPYDIYVQGNEKYVKGDTIYFKAFNKVTSGAIPVNYAWSIFPAAATIIDGLNTDTIAVSTKDLNGEKIRVTLDVNDGVYDETCKQNIVTETPPDIIKIEPLRCDIFEWSMPDPAKAIFDNCVIQLQNYPDAQLYVFYYQGTARRSKKIEAIQKITIDYLTRTRGVPRSQITETIGQPRLNSMVVIWIVPPGAEIPVP